MLILGIILLVESILLLVLTPITWQRIISYIGLLYACGLIALWILNNKTEDL